MADAVIEAPPPAAFRGRAGPDGYRLEGPSVSEANAFLEMLTVRGLSPATVRAYAFDLVLLLRWIHQSGRQLVSLDGAHLLGFVEVQRAFGASPASINRRLTTCEQFYGFVTGRPMSNGPALGAAPHYKGRGRDHALGLHQLKRGGRPKLRVKVPHKVVEPLVVMQVEALLASLRRYRDLTIVYLMLICGLRSGEVLGLRLCDVDMQERRLRVRGKGNRERVIPLADVIAGVVRDYLRLERPRAVETDRLLVVLQGRRRGQPMTAAGLRTLFRHRRSKTATLSNANPHRLRHTFGADMARAGVNLPVLQRLMGHADAKTTLLYVNLSMTDIADEYGRAVAVIGHRYERTP